MVEDILCACQNSKRARRLIEIADKQGKTPLYIAAERGRGKIVGTFLKPKPNLLIK
jgi:hypothetical protein